LTDGVRLIASGIVTGIAAAFVLSGTLRSFLSKVEPTDPVMLTAAGLLFAAIGLLTCWVPARRAVEVHALEALRCE
jgi:putative ABC transport system permease protein